MPWPISLTGGPPAMISAYRHLKEAQAMLNPVLTKATRLTGLSDCSLLPLFPKQIRIPGAPGQKTLRDCPHYCEVIAIRVRAGDDHLQTILVRFRFTAVGEIKKD